MSDREFPLLLFKWYCPPAASTHSNRLKRAISISGYQRLVALNQRLGVTKHMRFTDLMLYSHRVRHGLEPISVVGDQHRRSHTLGNWLNPVLERLGIFC